MIKNIVFDMGQVLIHWTPDVYLAFYDLTQEETELLRQELFQSVEWVALDHGTISEEAAVDAVCSRVPRKLHGIVEELVTGWWRKPMQPMEGMAELIAKLKARGYGIYLLSNAGLPLRQYFRWIPGSEYFDGLMVSAEEKLLKPQHEIFKALFQRFDLKPEECFFIDDNPMNVEGAACCDMSGTIFRGDVNRLRQEMMAAGMWL